MWIWAPAEIWFVDFCTRIHFLLPSSIIAPSFCLHSSKRLQNTSLILPTSFPDKDYSTISRIDRQCSKIFVSILHGSQSQQVLIQNKSLDTKGRANKLTFTEETSEGSTAIYFKIFPYQDRAISGVNGLLPGSLWGTNSVILISFM